MMFVNSLVTLLSDIIKYVLGPRIRRDHAGISATMFVLDIVQDGEREYLNGSEEHIELFMRILESLQIYHDHLLE